MEFNDIFLFAIVLMLLFIVLSFNHWADRSEKLLGEMIQLRKEQIKQNRIEAARERLRLDKQITLSKMALQMLIVRDERVCREMTPSQADFCEMIQGV